MRGSVPEALSQLAFLTRKPLLLGTYGGGEGCRWGCVHPSESRRRKGRITQCFGMELPSPFRGATVFWAGSLSLAGLENIKY